MCGIAGIITPNQKIIRPVLLEKMCASLAHRGPDGKNTWTNSSNKIGFAHTRLSIIDLSIAAAQPMHYANRYTIVYNGEIYNYIELKKDLQKNGYQFANDSDTEVILAAYDYYGEKCLQYFDGMFAFAIWDEKEQTLFAARDRFGEKPFYFYNDNGLFAFASEMKAIWAIDVPKEMDEKMILNFLTLGNVKNPVDSSQTFFKNIYSLRPAHFLKLQLDKGDFSLHKYWSLNKQNNPDNPANNYVALFKNLLTDSVKKRFRSDIPVGSSLSGGLDSSSVVALSAEILGQEKASTQFKTFSAIFPGFDKNEASHIEKVTQQFSLQNYTVTPTADGLINDFEKLCYHQEEPFPSSSIYAQYKVMELASLQNTRVLLDGQGADETLAGYHKYLHWYLQELVSRHRLATFLKEKKNFTAHGIEVEWGLKNIFAAFLPAQAAITLEKREYAKIITNTDISKNLLANLRGREWDGIHKPIVTKLNDILHFNTIEFGLEELLRFADRNSMAHGVEVRLPFLNTALVEFIFSAPTHYKIKDGFTKWMLRKSMNNILPNEIVWRTDKIGYEPPQKQWMENPILIDYTHEAKKKLVQHDFLKPQVLKKKLNPKDAHERNNYDWRYLCMAQML